MKQEVAVAGLQHAGAVQEAAMAGRSGARCQWHRPSDSAVGESSSLVLVN